MLEYKLKRYGIRFVKQEESYTSQCSPLSPEVGKRYAEPSNRKERGLYRDGNIVYNADAVGAYNILRKYHSVSGVKKELSVTGLKTPEIIKVPRHPDSGDSLGRKSVSGHQADGEAQSGCRPLRTNP